MPRDTSDLPQEEEVRDEQMENAEDDEEEEEYEIEEILEHRNDVFGKGIAGFYVKWKGYGEEDNSWVKMEDAENATELIEEYWAKQKASSTVKKRGRRSGASASAAKQNKSKATPISGDEDEAEEEDGLTKSRRRKQPDNKFETDEDEPEPTKKRARKSNGTSASAAGRRRGKAAEDIESESNDESSSKGPVKPSSLPTYKSKESWESFVTHIDTIERGPKNELNVYFRMSKIDGGCVENVDVCKRKFPQKMLTFYEKNLRWRMVEGDAVDNGAEE